jgi:hypothetical protein
MTGIWGRGAGRAMGNPGEYREDAAAAERGGNVVEYGRNRAWNDMFLVWKSCLFPIQNSMIRAHPAVVFDPETVVSLAFRQRV